jgi:hypothetical protein
MFGFHGLTCRVRGRRLWACFATGRPSALASTRDRRMLAMPAYRQWDGHSCGFVAALAVAHTFNPKVDPAAVLAAVRPTPFGGSSQRRLVRALRYFGVIARCYDRLDLPDLFRLVGQGRPVVVTVRSGVFGRDHWAVVRGVDRARRRIYLLNHSVWTDRGGLAWDDFQAIWRPHGVGLVCVSVGDAARTIPSIRS